MSSPEWKWNQAIIDDRETRARLGSGLVIFAAVINEAIMEPIGSGFIIGAFGNCATVVTAAHNLSGIHSLQKPEPAHHRSALPEFVPTPPPLLVDRQRVRVICFEGDTVEVAIIESVVYDERADIAVVKILSQNSSSTFFKGFFQLSNAFPEVGDEVAVLGRAKFNVADREKNGNYSPQKIGYELYLRRGYVKTLYPDGHLLCRGPCLETTIPVFGGMSGGPVMLMPSEGQAMMPFGVVSSDAEGETDKYDPSVAGSLIVALLPVSFAPLPNGEQEVSFRFHNAQIVRNSEMRAENRTSGIIKSASNTVDRCLAIATSYRSFGGNYICATAGLCIEQALNQENEIKAGEEVAMRSVPRLCFLSKAGINPERYGWMRVIEALMRHDGFNPAWSYGVVVNSEPGELQKINVKDEPMFEDFFIPDNIFFISASFDVCGEDFVNKLERATRGVADQSLDAALKMFAGHESIKLEKDFFDLTVLNDKVDVVL